MAHIWRMERIDLHSPFVQLILLSTAVTIALIFPVHFALEHVVPGLGRPLFVPTAVALLLGTLGFLVEKTLKHYALAILELLVAIVLFPLLAWILLVLFHVPYQTREADFIALIPQTFIGPSYFEFIRKRFEK
jgi:hypothetical protein